MADWSDISDLWWLQPQRESGRALQGLALGARMREARTQENWRAEQAQVLMDQRRAAMQTQEAKTRGIAAVSSYMSEVASNNAWTNPNAKAGLLKLLSQYPQTFDDPTSTSFLRLFETAEAREAQAKQHAQTTTITELEEADFLDWKADKAEAQGPLDEERQKEVSQQRQRAMILRGKHMPTGETFEVMDPNTGQVVTRVSRGGGRAAEPPGTLTVATRTKRQQDLMGYADVAETLAYINKNKNASDFGVRGQFKELYARVAGQMGIEVPEGTVSTRAAVTTLRAALVKSLRSDSNIAEAERKVLEKSIPSTSDITESFATAVDKLNEAARNIWGRSTKAAEDLQMPVPPWVIPPDKLRDQFRAGRYGDPTSQAAQDAFIRDLRRYHGFD